MLIGISIAARIASIVTTLVVLLQAEPGKWAGWLMTGSDEMVKLVDEQLHETADWENNLKALKAGFYASYSGVQGHKPHTFICVAFRFHNRGRIKAAAWQ